MQLKPLITVKACESISFAQAHRLIKKFHNVCTARASQSLSLTHGKNEPTVSEDILEKLSVLVTEVKRQADRQPVVAETRDEQKDKKKRKRESQVAPSTEKKKKSKKNEMQ